MPAAACAVAAAVVGPSGVGSAPACFRPPAPGCPACFGPPAPSVPSSVAAASRRQRA